MPRALNFPQLCSPKDWGSSKDKKSLQETSHISLRIQSIPEHFLEGEHEAGSQTSKSQNDERNPKWCWGGGGAELTWRPSLQQLALVFYWKFPTARQLPDGSLLTIWGSPAGFMSFCPGKFSTVNFMPRDTCEKP